MLRLGAAPLRPRDSPSPPRHAVETRVPACPGCPPLCTLLVRLSVAPTLALGRVLQITAFCSPPRAVVNYSPAPVRSWDSHLRPRPRPRAGAAGPASGGKQPLLRGALGSRLEEALPDKRWRRGRSALQKERRSINPERICITAGRAGRVRNRQSSKAEKVPILSQPSGGFRGNGEVGRKLLTGGGLSTVRETWD